MTTQDFSHWIDDPALRKVAENPVDRYFIDKSQEIPAPEEATPVLGYRFMLHYGDKYYSPFGYVAPSQVRDALAKLGYDEEHIGAMHEMFGLGHTAQATSLQAGIVNHDAEGLGYFYWPTQDLAEDYMKTFAIRHGEQQQTPKGIWYSDVGGTAWPTKIRDVKEYNEMIRGQPNLQPLPGIDQGTFELLRVRGYATKNDFDRDTYAGFTMQDMVIDPDPIISFKQDMPAEVLGKLHTGLTERPSQAPSADIVDDDELFLG